MGPSGSKESWLFALRAKSEVQIAWTDFRLDHAFLEDFRLKPRRVQYCQFAALGTARACRPLGLQHRRYGVSTSIEATGSALNASRSLAYARTRASISAVDRLPTRNQTIFGGLP